MTVLLECRVFHLLGFGSSPFTVWFGEHLAFILLYYVRMSFVSRDCIVCTVVI